MIIYNIIVIIINYIYNYYFKPFNLKIIVHFVTNKTYISDDITNNPMMT